MRWPPVTFSKGNAKGGRLLKSDAQSKGKGQAVFGRLRWPVQNHAKNTIFRFFWCLFFFKYQIPNPQFFCSDQTYQHISSILHPFSDAASRRTSRPAYACWGRCSGILRAAVGMNGFNMHFNHTPKLIYGSWWSWLKVFFLISSVFVHAFHPEFWPQKIWWTATGTVDVFTGCPLKGSVAHSPAAFRSSARTVDCWGWELTGSFWQYSFDPKI